MDKSQLKQAKADGVHVVDSKLLDNCHTGDVAALVLKHSIADWGSDVRVFSL